MQIGQKGLELIAREEGFVGCPYWDSYGRVWTRGYGETEGITQHSKCITQHEGIERLKNIFDTRYAYAINDLGVKLNQNQFDALSSFIWNCGVGAMQWNVGVAVKEHRFYDAANDLLQYCYSNGVYLSGLARRRHNERDLFLTPDGPPPPPSNPLDVLYPNERKAYDEYKKSPNKKLKIELDDFRMNIFEAAVNGHLYTDKHHKTEKGWDINNRKARYKLLRAITK